MKGLIITAIRLYQAAISPFLGGRCRHVPTCSEYAILAVRIDGVLTGLSAAARRLLRCHPLGGRSGFDPYIPRSERG